MSDENYDGDDARLCPFCGTSFSTEADPCLDAALDKIAELEAEVAKNTAEGARLRAESADAFFDAWGGRLDADPALFRYDGVTFSTALARWQDWRAALTGKE